MVPLERGCVEGCERRWKSSTRPRDGSGYRYFDCCLRFRCLPYAGRRSKGNNVLYLAVSQSERAFYIF
ncbi:hypothetical protein OUZ56_013873 [Daphnia magna]|uniref:Uncharacterized protein n=1 Tax=Daphnia magna TaxID=35525 RepID=A0ABQ9Z8B1_9CRUS|nr:hypothetical protein OUZ56_013873 [Daphnia magna]